VWSPSVGLPGVSGALHEIFREHLIRERSGGFALGGNSRDEASSGFHQTRNSASASPLTLFEDDFG